MKPAAQCLGLQEACETRKVSGEICEAGKHENVDFAVSTGQASDANSELVGRYSLLSCSVG